MGMSETQTIDRTRWWSWSDELRAQWTKWFEERGLSTDLIAEFRIDGETVEADRYIEDLDGLTHVLVDGPRRTVATDVVTIETKKPLPPISV